jgi:predicted ATPase
MEREFGFGIVRQLFAADLRSRDEAERARLFAGPAALAAPIFELADDAALDAGTGEGALYGLFWLSVALAERGPVTIAVDDAHWSDAASLRFIRYLGRRLDGLPVLIALAARPHEPGVQAEMLSALGADLDPEAVRPSLLSASATAAIVRAHLGDGDAAVEAACHEATGGNPFLVEELLVELDLAGEEGAAFSPERIAAVGPERIATTVIERARRLDPLGPEIVCAVAVLGDRASLGPIAALAGTEQGRAAAILDGLVAASILVDGSAPRFAHPLLRAAVYESMPAATRETRHAHAASLLAERGADPEEVAAHLLLCEPGSVAGGLGALDAAARRAAARGRRRAPPPTCGGR